MPPEPTDIAARKGKPASPDPAIRAAETIVYQSKFPPHAFEREGNETVARFARIIRTAFSDVLAEIEGAHREIDLWWPHIPQGSLYQRIRAIHEEEEQCSTKSPTS